VSAPAALATVASSETGSIAYPSVPLDVPCEELEFPHIPLQDPRDAMRIADFEGIDGDDDCDETAPLLGKRLAYAE
jgi:hypothetical protein